MIAIADGKVETDRWGHSQFSRWHRNEIRMALGHLHGDAGLLLLMSACTSSATYMSNA